MAHAVPRDDPEMENAADAICVNYFEGKITIGRVTWGKSLITQGKDKVTQGKFTMGRY